MKYIISFLPTNLYYLFIYRTTFNFNFNNIKRSLSMDLSYNTILWSKFYFYIKNLCKATIFTLNLYIMLYNNCLCHVHIYI